MTHNQTVRGLQVLNHGLLLAGVWYLFASESIAYLWLALAVYYFTGIIGINVCMHRLLSHRSFATHALLEKLMSVVGVLTTIGSPLAWVALHRQHHRTADKPGDPHSPYQLGKWRAWFGFWNYAKIDLKLIRDLRKDKFQKALHKYYLHVIALYCIALCLVDPWLVVFAYAIPACLCLHSSSAIIVIAHIHGYKTHKVNDESRNSWIANLITMGEGWHNNHHAKPYAWSNWEKWWEFDVPSLVIRAIKK